ncbi:MAG TPA: SDR family oxidoreductase, partial [Candidatus Agrococcus pullicola]|nr:SDR family oxidoreductase [Candidatus Agrococcus pullicola]
VTRALEHRIRPGGAVVSIGSIGAEYAGNPYSASKAALQAWNAGVSERLGARDITANVVAPGYVEGTNLFGGPLGADRRTALVERTHTKRVGKPEDIGSIVSFLASPKARHITGQTMHVNGGAHTTR